MRKFIGLGSVTALICAHTQLSFAQQATQPSLPIQPSTNVFIPPATGSVTYPTFTVESGVGCPTPVLNIQGFGSGVNNSTAYADRYSGYGNYGNYGFAAGLSVPLYNGLMEFCKRAAAAKAKKAELDTWTTLINNCAALKDKGIEIEFFPGLPEEYKKCKFIKFTETVSRPSGGNGFVEPPTKGMTLERFTPQQGGILQLVP